MTTATLTHRYEPWGAARDAFSYRGAELLLSGPAGTGKSRALIEKMHAMCLLNPGMRALMVRKVRETLTNTGLVTYKKIVAAEAIDRKDVTEYGGSSTEPPQFRYPNGATINFGGMDKATKIMSSEYDLIYVQEAIELSPTDWENLTTRLRNGKVSFQQLMGDTNPDAPTHWLKARVDRGATHMLDTRHEDNPILCNPDGSYTERGAAYMTALDNLTGVRKERLRYGRWAAAEGLIYEDFDRSIHLKRIAEVPSTWARYWSVDFGYTNPFVLQCWAVDPDGRLHLYRELYRSQRLVEDHARDILAIVAPDGTWREPRPHQIICDHDAEDRATLERHLGMPTVAATKTVSDGIQAVQARLRKAGDGRPRITLDPTCTVEIDHELEGKQYPTNTIAEIPAYVWDKPKEGTAAAEKAPKEEPRKLHDHGCLVAGTLVDTFMGLRPIEEIREGDIVRTRAGMRAVLGAGMTDDRATVYRVVLSDGGELVGTGNHPVWVHGKEWVRLDALRYNDRLWTCPTEKLSSTTASSSGVTPAPPTGLNAATTCQASQTGNEACDACTKKSGAPSTGTSPTATRSTTPTSIPSTTTSVTSCVSPDASTAASTKSEAENADAANLHRPTSNESGHSPRTGTAPTPDANGTANTHERKASDAVTSGSAYASTAASRSRPDSCPSTNGSAQADARPQPATPAASTTSNAPAPSAVDSSPSTATPAPSAAPVHVLSVVAVGIRRPVYNLTVADVPEYFAGGVLVHNCDSLRYMVAHLDLQPKPRMRGWL